VNRLAELLNLGRLNNRGRPLTPVQQVCVALNFYAAGSFTHIAALCGGVSQKTAWRAINRVTNQLCLLKAQFIRMPTNQEMAETAQRLLDKFHLPDFAFGVDGVVVKFDGAPRNIPRRTVKQDFWNRKMVYAINVQIVGNDRHLIHDINVDWQGANNDARIWNNSPVKQVIQRQRRYLLAGDSGYPISDVLVTPYRNAEAAVDLSKRKFNRWHSALRTVCTENIFGIWKRRFPCLKVLRCQHPRARKVVIATAILHNISILWGDEEPVGVVDDDETHAAPQVPAQEYEIVEDDAEPAVVWARGQTVRDRLRLQLPPGLR
jgi:hypothetical protein